MATTTIKSDIFTWNGTDKTGRSSKGEIEAASQAMAKAKLRQQGIKPKTVRRKPKALFGGKGKAIKAADIAIFTRQLAISARRLLYSKLSGIAAISSNVECPAPSIVRRGRTQDHRCLRPVARL